MSQPVELAYSVDVYGSERSIQLPFHICVIADLLAERLPEEEGTTSWRTGQNVGWWFLPRRCHLDNLNDLMERFAPTITVTFELPDIGHVPERMTFRSMRDLTPAGIAEQVPHLRQLLNARDTLLQTRSLIERAANPEGLASRLLDVAAIPDEDRDVDVGAEMLAAISHHVTETSQDEYSHLVRFHQDFPASEEDACQYRRDPTGWLAQMVDGIDGRIASDVSRVLEHSAYRAIERTWLGIEHLVRSVWSSDPPVRVSLLHMAGESAEAMESGHLDSLDKSLRDEFAMLGGEPVGLLVLDRPMSAGAADVTLLEQLARLAENWSLPVIGTVAPDFFGTDNFDQLNDRTRLSELFKLPEYDGWRRLRAHPGTRWMALAVPSLAARPPHVMPGGAFGRFGYQEAPNDRPTLNPAYVIATGFAAAFAASGWLRPALDTEAGLDPPATQDFVDAAGQPRFCSPATACFGPETAEALTSIGFLLLETPENTDGIRIRTWPSLFDPGLHRKAPTPDTNFGVNAVLGQVVRTTAAMRRDKMHEYAADAEHLQRFARDFDVLIEGTGSLEEGARLRGRFEPGPDWSRRIGDAEFLTQPPDVLLEAYFCNSCIWLALLDRPDGAPAHLERYALPGWLTR